MLARKIVATKFYEIIINYGLKVDSEFLANYGKLMYDMLLQEKFTNEEFVKSADRIMTENKTLYGVMPSLGMYIEHSYKRNNPFSDGVSYTEYYEDTLTDEEKEERLRLLEAKNYNNQKKLK